MSIGLIILTIMWYFMAAGFFGHIWERNKLTCIMAIVLSPITIPIILGISMSEIDTDRLK